MTKTPIIEYFKYFCLTAILLNLSASLFAAEHKTGEIWLDRCARCHGDTGDGNTPLGRKLKVADYRTQEMQQKLTDDYIRKLIIEGKIVGDKAVMPSFKDELSTDDVQELIAYIRKLAK